MSPFSALYGYAPPHLAFPVEVTSSVAAVESYLRDRDAMLDLLKESRHKSQEWMKFFDDKKRSDRSFEVGDQVFLKLQPYRQSSMAVRSNFKLSTRYYDPFQVTQKIGSVAYRLALPAASKIHPVFHVSQLKNKLGTTAITVPSLPLTDEEGEIVLIPIAASDYHQDYRQGRAVQQVLIQWSHTTPDDATWEDVANVQAYFLKFNL
ncbi:uncharacterized protein LOC113331843 [Papaver somniferum]|uniref:uncharacterized protein LOC113331843 n=1 Tax=Papaver somniferum TaxID=3469 RepID=UPI000E701BAE|nr:uncharacterized protein LOC113331843 [Papaver somniferum]